MTDAQRKRQQGNIDIQAISQTLDANRTLASATRGMSSVRIRVVVGLLTGLYPRTRPKAMAILQSYYH